jgi:hypothetical protein
MDRAGVPWGYMPFLAIGSLIFGAWLATSALNDVLHAYMRERLGQERAANKDAGEV